jgi:Cysteine dioxygenase type I
MLRRLTAAVPDRPASGVFLMSHRDQIRRRCLNAIELIELTRQVAAEVISNKYPFIKFDADARWHQRIYRDGAVDVWLITWLPSQGTQLHDHGGSAGSFTVISGELAEAVYVRTGTSTGDLQEQTRPAGCSVGFDARYVHDVRNLSLAPAVSVHAYSRPLTSMTYYNLSAGALEPVATLDTDDPEPAFDVRAAS